MSPGSHPWLLLAVASTSLTVACGDNFIFLGRADAGSTGGADGDSVVDSVSSGAGGESPGGGAGGTQPGVDAGGDASETSDAGCASHAQCLDNDLCNGTELCVDGVCRAGTALRCDDGSPCTLDACLPLTGACSFTALEDGSLCLDGDLCDGEVCVAGQCSAGSPVTCGSDGNPCTEDTCNPATGACEFPPLATGAPCSDGDLCNGTERCAAGLCLSGPDLSCDDANPCTVDSCNALLGCTHDSAADGTSCADANLCNGSESCLAGVCQPGVALSCNDGNVCTTDACNPQNGACTFAPLHGVPCADGNLCDGQTCQNGTCAPGSPVICASDNDNNPCTANACNPASGICAPGNVANGTPCPDGDLCDGTESCLAGSCSVAGTPLVCPDDGNFCTTDSCAPAFGCLHLPVPDGMVCPDADRCDGTEVCTGGICGAGIPVSCTAPQACNPLSGECQ